MEAPPQATVLVADDEDSVADLLCDALSLAGYTTIRAANGMEALRLVRESRPDLLLLDVNMPLLDGFEVLERLRAQGDEVPVLFLTARDDRLDERKGLSLGGDDYVTKPFGLQELLLRVGAILRRSRPPVIDRRLRVSNVALDPDTYEVTVADEPVELSPTEFRLLEQLMSHKGRVLTRDQLLRLVWGLDGDTRTSVLETYVSYLRRKVDPDNLGIIRTVRGIGYQLREPDDKG
jgi:two-component system, OmpR family, response regulator